MKTNNLFIILAIFGLIITSCSVDTIRVDGNDYITTKNYNYFNYSAIEISSGFNAYVTFSDTEESIEIEANDNLFPYIITSNNNNTLVVKLKNNINIRGASTLKVHIKTKSITSFKASADTRIYLQNKFIANNAKISLSADSFFTGELDVNSLQYYGSADTRSDLKGKVNFLDANLTADSKISNYGLEINDLKIKMSADCDAYLTILGTIDVNAVADCTLYYKGNATIINQHLVADSRIIKKQ
ncbi:GIN domain-containing protein [Mariniflexile sp. HMF6888]|uniref:GIN domain-containing protein n=1 Tax=Mariniflexile sp. HMF6888 TaxID=3373086 RepID=UPI0037B350C0